MVWQHSWYTQVDCILSVKQSHTFTIFQREVVISFSMKTGAHNFMKRELTSILFHVHINTINSSTIIVIHGDCQGTLTGYYEIEIIWGRFGWKLFLVGSGSYMIARFTFTVSSPFSLLFHLVLVTITGSRPQIWLPLRDGIIKSFEVDERACICPNPVLQLKLHFSHYSSTTWWKLWFDFTWLCRQLRLHLHPTD